MVPVIAPSHLEARAALRSLITESCRRDLSKVFVAWLLQESEQRAESASIAAQAAKREGADQDFQTIATLGIAVDAGLLSEPQVAALKRGLSRLAGRSPTINEVPMAFCADAVGILGVALGTRSIKDPVVTGQVVGWVAKFLKTSYERGGADDWQRCLFAVADRQLGGTLGLSVPESASTADVRTALVAKGLIEVGDGKKAREDEAQTLALAVQETPKDFAYDRAALRLAAVEWVIRQARPPSGPIFIQETAKGSMDRPSQTDPIWTITSSQKGPIPVTRLNGEVVWINTADPDEPDDAAYTPEDELRVAEVTLNGRSELRSEIETVFGGPAWPPASAIVEPFRRYATKVFDVNAAAYRRVASTQARGLARGSQRDGSQFAQRRLWE